jgi:hypothetical protein
VPSFKRVVGDSSTRAKLVHEAASVNAAAAAHMLAPCCCRDSRRHCNASAEQVCVLQAAAVEGQLHAVGSQYLCTIGFQGCS